MLKMIVSASICKYLDGRQVRVIHNVIPRNVYPIKDILSVVSEYRNGCEISDLNLLFCGHIKINKV